MSGPAIGEDMGPGESEARSDFKMGSQAEGKEGQTQGQTKTRNQAEKGDLSQGASLLIPLTSGQRLHLVPHTPGLLAECRSQQAWPAEDPIPAASERGQHWRMGRGVSRAWAHGTP